MIINVTGYGSTGASAYIDFLKGVNNVQHYPGAIEFQIIEQPDGIKALFNALYRSGRNMNSVGIRRFVKNIGNTRNKMINAASNGKMDALTREFVEAISPVSWMGTSVYDPIDLKAVLEKRGMKVVRVPLIMLCKLLKRNWAISKKQMYITISEEEYIDEVQKYISKILVESGFDLQQPIILEQALDCNDPISGSCFLPSDVYSIIVDRDPRDVFLLTNVIFPHLNGFMPNAGNVEQFVEYYKAVHRNRVDHPNVKYYAFEDLVFNFVRTASDITAWLKVEIDAAKMEFKPEYSINNTQLFLQFPEYKKDIDYIEKELTQYLYDFDENTNNFGVKRIVAPPF